MDEHRREVNVEVDFDYIINVDLEGFIDTILEQAGHPLGMDVIYKLVGATDEGDAIINVEFTIPHDEEEYS